MNSKIWNVEGVVRECTPYEGIYKYIAPNGYCFYVDNTSYGNVIYGKDILENPYILKSSNN